MFCAIATTIERCKTEGVVDIFQVVKALRVQKPGAILNVVSTQQSWYQLALCFYVGFCSYVCNLLIEFQFHVARTDVAIRGI